MQLTDRDKKLLLLLASVLLLAGAYVFGYKGYGERRKTLENQISKLEAKYDDMSKKNEKRQTYLDETEANREKAKEILARYPESLLNQNAVYYTKQLEDGTGVMISQVAYADPVSFYVGSEETHNSGMEGMKSSAIISMTSDYTQLKRLFTFIANGDQRRVIQELNLSRDSNGLIGGTIAYDTYSLSGADSEPEKVTIPNKQEGQGVPQLFGDLIKR